MSDEKAEASSAAIDFTKLAQEATAVFFTQMQKRHDLGQEKYGPIKFMNVNTLVEAMEEVVDLANYAMYTFMKLYVLNEQMQQVVADNQIDLLGQQAFMKAGE